MHLNPKKSSTRALCRIDGRSFFRPQAGVASRGHEERPADLGTGQLRVAASTLQISNIVQHNHCIIMA